MPKFHSTPPTTCTHMLHARLTHAALRLQAGNSTKEEMDSLRELLVSQLVDFNCLLTSLTQLKPSPTLLHTLSYPCIH